MKFEGSGSKGTRVIERKRSVTDGQGKNNMSPPEGGRHNHLGMVRHNKLGVTIKVHKDIMYCIIDTRVQTSKTLI